MKQYTGYYNEKELPIKQNDIVIIPKGTKIFEMKNGTWIAAKRSFKIKVNHIMPGQTIGNTPTENPRVCWAGSGGYWHEVDINDVLYGRN